MKGLMAVASMLLVLLVSPSAFAADRVVEWNGHLEIVNISNDGFSMKLAGIEFHADDYSTRRMPCPWVTDPYFGLRDLFTCSMLGQARVTNGLRGVKVLFKGSRVKTVLVRTGASYSDMVVTVETDQQAYQLCRVDYRRYRVCAR